MSVANDGLAILSMVKCSMLTLLLYKYTSVLLTVFGTRQGTYIARFIGVRQVCCQPALTSAMISYKVLALVNE